MKYTLEQIMAAWAAYKRPLHFFNGRKVKERELNGIFSNERILTDETTSLEVTDNYKLGIGFPEFLMDYLSHPTKKGT